MSRGTIRESSEARASCRTAVSPYIRGDVTGIQEKRQLYGLKCLYRNSTLGQDNLRGEVRGINTQTSFFMISWQGSSLAILKLVWQLTAYNYWSLAKYKLVSGTRAGCRRVLRGSKGVNKSEQKSSTIWKGCFDSFQTWNFLSNASDYEEMDN